MNASIDQRRGGTGHNRPHSLQATPHQLYRICIAGKTCSAMSFEPRTYVTAYNFLPGVNSDRIKHAYTGLRLVTIRGPPRKAPTHAGGRRVFLQKSLVSLFSC